MALVLHLVGLSSSTTRTDTVANFSTGCVQITRSVAVTATGVDVLDHSMCAMWTNCQELMRLLQVLAWLQTTPRLGPKTQPGLPSSPRLADCVSFSKALSSRRGIHSPAWNLLTRASNCLRETNPPREGRNNNILATRAATSMP